MFYKLFQSQQRLRHTKVTGKRKGGQAAFSIRLHRLSSGGALHLASAGHAGLFGLDLAHHLEAVA